MIINFKYLSIAIALSTTSYSTLALSESITNQEFNTFNSYYSKSVSEKVISASFKSDMYFIRTLNSVSNNNVKVLEEIYKETLGKITKDKSNLIKNQINIISNYNYQNYNNMENSFLAAGTATGLTLGKAGVILAGAAVVGVAAAAGGGGGSDKSDDFSLTNPPKDEPPKEDFKDELPKEDPKDELPKEDPKDEPIVLVGKYEFRESDSFKMSQEYINNRTFEDTKGYVPHGMGLTGKGSVIGVLDSGAVSHTDLNNANIIGGYSVYDGVGKYEGSSSHGTVVLGAMAAQKNGFGTVGYAPGASYYIVKLADEEGKFTSSQSLLSNGFKYALDNGSNIINNSWSIRSEVLEGEWNRFTFASTYRDLNAQYKRAIDNDVVIVYAAANNAWDNPSITGALPYYFPEYQKGWLNVVSLSNETGLLSSYSNKCGVSYEYCLSVPDQWILSTTLNNGYTLTRGTSLAAPIASASIALVKEQFPMLSYQESAKRLLLTANKNGIYSDHLTYGQGVIDLEKAMNPLGETYLFTENNNLIPTSEMSINYASSFGDVSNEFKNINTMIVDEQGAGFYVNLSDFIKTNSYSLNSKKNIKRISNDNIKNIQLDKNSYLIQSFNENNKIESNIVNMNFDNKIFKMGFTQNPDIFLDSFNGNNIVSQNHTLSFSSPFINNQKDNDSYLYGFTFGHKFNNFDLEITNTFHDKTYNINTAYIKKINDNYNAKIELGMAKSNEGLFGEDNSSSNYLENKNTTYVGFSGKYENDYSFINHAFYIGDSQGSEIDILNTKNILSTSWSIGTGYKNDNQVFGFNINQPLRVESAKTTVNYVKGYSEGQYHFGQKDINLKSSGRQINSEVYWQNNISENSQFRASFMNINQPGHNKNKKDDNSIMFSYKIKF